MADERVSGRVKWFSTERGYGFIECQDGSDVYVNIREVQQAGLSNLEAGQALHFVVRRTPQGNRAYEIGLAEEEKQTGDKATAGSPLHSTHTDFVLDSSYLAGGYFEDEDKKYLRPEVVDMLAIDIAKVLGTASPPMQMHQLRRFFNKARGIEGKLDNLRDFRAIKADILSFKRNAVYQVGRKLVPQEFQTFIDRNVVLALEDEQSFRKGFIPHFESVLAYFVYFFQQ